MVWTPSGPDRNVVWTHRGLDPQWPEPGGWSRWLWSQGELSGQFFPDHAGKGSLRSRYEVEMGLLWIWAGLSCFLSSGDGYVGELLELQQGCEGPFGSSRC